MNRTLISHDNPKAAKSTSYGYLNGIHYLAPHTLSGRNLCPWAKNCIEICLNLSGKGVLDSVQQSRLAKSEAFQADPESYLAELSRQLSAMERKASAEGLKAAFRFNGTSDVSRERFKTLMERHPEVRWYDYTKSYARCIANLGNREQYDLTFSRDGVHNERQCEDLLAVGGRVAVVFRKSLPATWHGFPVVDGDTHDLRFLDPVGVVVGLKAKGRAKKDTSGFVVDVA